MQPKEFISTQEAAEKWGITESFVRRMARQGRIPGALKRGRDWWIPKGAKRPEDGRKKP
jgi:excisionase family DNA binding protein